MDKSLTQKRSGTSVVLISQKGESFEFAIQLAFTTTNNEAECEAVIAKMGIARKMGAKNLEERSDSHVIVGHILGE
jgi:ribonuclease HI